MGMGCIAKGIAYSLVTIVAGCASADSAKETESQRLQRWTDAIEQNERQQEYWPEFKKIEYLPDLRSYARKYNTLAHDILDTEKEFGSVPADYKYLDDLIDKAKKRIHAKRDCSYKDAIDTLSEIDLILRENRFTFEETEFLNQALKKGTFDCDTSAFLYLAIAESMDLPLFYVVTTHHAFVRWEFGDGKHINWETNVSANSRVGRFSNEKPDSKYLDDLKKEGIAKEADKYLWLKSLDKKQALASVYLNNALKYKFGRENLEKAIEFFTKSIELCPREEVYVLRCGAFKDAGNLEKSLEDCNKLIELSPQDKGYLEIRDALLRQIEAKNIAKELAESQKRLDELQKRGEQERAESERERAQELEDKIKEMNEAQNTAAPEQSTGQYSGNAQNISYSTLYFALAGAFAAALLLSIFLDKKERKA
jgi:regulator of sirC expression with transglutaminase-like and TPR domain